MAGRLPRVTGATGVVDTSDQGGFFGGIVHASVATAQEPVAAANEVRLYMFVLTFRATITKIATETATSEASSLYSVGIYNVDGTALLVDSGTFNGASTGIKQNTITAVTLEPGPYLFAQTANTTTTLQVRTCNIVLLNAISNGTDIVNTSTAANASSSGVLPATTGSLTRDSSRQITAAFFAP